MLSPTPEPTFWSLTMLALVDLYLLLTKHGVHIGPMHLWNGFWLFSGFCVPACLLLSAGLRGFILRKGPRPEPILAAEPGVSG